MSPPDDPIDAPELRWGVLAPGGIASAFTDALHRYTRSRVVAVGSRSRERAREFATAHGVPTGYGSYAELVEDPSVQAVYVASPHSEHMVHALLAISAGKHVLVEKAFTRNAAEAGQVFDAAQAADVFVMEAMWTRFLPHVAALREVLARGEIGDVVGLIADHGQHMGHLPDAHRLHNPELAGGALLDLGVYPVSFAHDLLGVPDRVRALGSPTPTGVDGQVSVTLGFGGRAQASLHTTLWARTPTTAVVFGSAGRIEVTGAFYAPTTFDVVRDDGNGWTFDGRIEGGLQYEAAEVARCVTAGLPESPRMGWQASIEVMGTMDEIRRQVGLAYTGE